MVSVKENAERMKTKLLAYWRFERHFPYAGTEVGPYNADVLVAKNENYIIEIEVKNTWSDFLHDFSKRFYNYSKHDVYQKAKGDFSPHAFYFAVPKELVSKVCNHIKRNNYPYGVLGILRGNPNKRKAWIRTFKRHKVLHNLPRPRLLRSLILRESSELVNKRLKSHV